VDPSHPDRTSKRKKKGSEPPEHTERSQKRRKTEYFVPSTPLLEGTSAQVRGWSYGNLPKRDAQRFYRTVRQNYLSNVSFGIFFKYWKKFELKAPQLVQPQ
jgi:hypothetical protein